MKTKSDPKGFSVAKLLIIILVIAGLAAGGYFGYAMYHAPTDAGQGE